MARKPNRKKQPMGLPAGIEFTDDRWPLERLKPFERNPREHSPEQVSKIARSMEAFGFTVPILVDPDGEVIAGHGRLLAAQLIGLPEAPVRIAKGLTDDQKRAYRITDNQLTLDGDWKAEDLAFEMRELEQNGFDLTLTGFEPVAVDSYLRGLEGDGQGEAEDETPEPPADPVSRRGDTWLLGKHRLRCGDSTSADDVAALLNGVEPHLMVTDPPYGVNYDPSWRPELNKVKPGFSTGKHAEGRVKNDDNADWREAWALFPGDVAYVWHAGTKGQIVAESLAACDFEIRAQIVWAKANMVISRGHYHPKHEPCWYAVRKGGKSAWNGDRTQTTVWEIEHRKSETGHGTQKPVEAMRRPILNNSKRGDAVYEPFAGSGTTIIACESEGRVSYAMELDPTYIDVCVRRWEAHTGQSATLEGDGRRFDEIAAERATEAA